MGRDHRSTWGWAAAAAASFVALWLATARTWTDVLVDFGRELYVAWRIAEGEALHRDLEWFAGPLSATVNGLLFRCFGASLATLVAANTALAVATFGAVFALVRRYAGAANAGVVTIAALALFGFGQHGGIGNYDYVTPYSHEPVHGLVLGAAATIAARRAAARAARGTALLSGALLGLVFLTKAEPFVAAVAGVATALVVAPTRGAARLAPALLLGFSLALGVAFALFAGTLGAAGAARAVLGTWAHLVGSDVAGARFYERLAGRDAPLRSLGVLARWSAAWGVALVVVVVAARFARASAASRLAAGALAFAAFGAARAALSRDDVYDVGGPVLVATALVALVAGWRVLRASPDSGPASSSARAAFVFAAFALASLVKLGLRPTFVFYGFVHALPAFAVVAAATLRVLPGAAERCIGAPRRLVHAGLVGLVAAVAALSLSSAAHWRRFKTQDVGAGPDRILADGRGDEVRQALAWLAAHTTPSDTVLVLPEGLSLNYWARRRTPTRFLGFMPTELAMFGEDRIVAALEAAAPSVVVLVHKDTSEYGPRFFGADYGRALGAWIGARYVPVAQFGAPPFFDHRFGIVVMAPR